MNKTITVNIGGLVFHVDENAYEKLKQYLHSIRQYFTAEDGREEIIQDIESRIAEMFQERLKDAKQVVIMEDVDHVIGIMGRPEQFAEGSDAFEPEAKRSKSPKRLYRDNDDKIIAGVCAGLAHYINIDTVWMRIIFIIIALFSAGTIVIAYIILLIVVPKALSPAEKLEMKGEPVNLASLKKSTAEGFDGIKNKISDLTEDAREFGRSDTVKGASNAIERFLEVVVQVIGWVLKAFIFFIGIVLAIAGVSMLIAFIFSILAIFGVAGALIPSFISDMFITSGQQVMASLGFFFVFALPVLFLVYLIVKAIFKIQYSNKIIGLSTLVLWIVGIVMLFALGIGVASEFSSHKSTVQQTELSSNEDTWNTLVLKGAPLDEEGTVMEFFDKMSITEDGKKVLWGDVNLDVEASQDNKFYLVQKRKSNGKSLKQAVNNASAIGYNYTRQDSVFTFDEFFSIPKGTKFRGQEVDLTILVPVGKKIYLDPSSRDVIYDIENVTNTWDGDMMGKTWTMTEAGLECVGCVGIEKAKADEIIHLHDGDDDIKVKIGKEGVHININEEGESHDIDAAQIDISEDGVYIRGEDNEEIRINKDGVTIKD